MRDPYAEFESTQMPNGLTVYALRRPDCEWLATQFVIHSGAIHDVPGLEGTAHFMEHLVNENGGSSPLEIMAFFEERGGRSNLGSTGYPATQYSFFAPAEDTVLQEALALFGNMLIRAKLEHHVERERKVIVGEYHQKFSTPFYAERHQRTREVVFPGTWFSRIVSPLGSLESIARIGHADLQRYYDTHYTPANISVVCVGNKTLKEVVALLQESPFGDHKPGSRSPTLVPTTDVPFPSVAREHVSLREQMIGIATAQFVSSAQIPGSISEPVLNLFESMLQRVLFEEIRLKRMWTYDIRCDATWFGEFSPFEISAKGLVPEALESIETVVNNSIQEAAERSDLLEQYRRSRIARTKMRDMPDQGICSSAASDVRDHGRIITTQEDIDILEHLTSDDIVGLAAFLQSERRFSVLMHP